MKDPCYGGIPKEDRAALQYVLVIDQKLDSESDVAEDAQVRDRAVNYIAVSDGLRSGCSRLHSRRCV